jgi:homoserine kinase
MKSKVKIVRAFAPATIANVAVGFDILGFAIDAVGDTVTIEKTSSPGKVEIESITGSVSLPLDPHKNTATIGLVKILQDYNLPFGFKVNINKGIPLSSGMGGSAASSVASVIAANEFLPQPLSRTELLNYALEGEKFASGALHADNLAPALYGGLNLVRSLSPIDIILIPSPDLFCVLIHPDLKVETKYSRSILKSEIPLKKFVEQSANLAAFIAACFKNDLELIRRSCNDLIIEEQRIHLIPGFMDVKKAALNANALACSLSGSGPSLFALAENEADAVKIQFAMTKAFNKNNILKIDSWISPISKEGARVIHSET